MSQPGSGWPQCFNYFFGQLSGCINCGPGKWKARCPAHDDKVQSLSVRVGARGQLYVRCHAGGLCSLDAILRAAGCAMDDLFPDNRRYTNKKGSPHMDRTETVYPYHDETGTLLFEAVRREPKGFRQRRPNPDFDHTVPASRENPEYLYDLQGVRRVLYNLPVVLSALQKTPDKAVFVVEGEKDVETARGLGITATTNPMGAGKWLADYALSLKGANVVVIPDNDEAGKAHAKAVCDSLKGVARTVRLVELPGLGEKEDLTDWLTKVVNGTADQKKTELRKLVGAAKLWGTDQTTVPTMTPAKTEPAPKQEPTPMPATDAAGTTAENFPNSPTIRGGAGLPNPAPGIAPPIPPLEIPLDVPPPEPVKAAPAPALVGTVPSDRGARVAAWFRDVKATAATLKLAGAQVKSHMEFYAAVRMTVAQMDQAFSMADGAPKLDAASLGQLSLLFGAYMVQAAADFGLGCGLMPDEPKPQPEPGK